LNKALKNGFKSTNDGVIASLTKKHVALTFDFVIKTLDDGCVTDVLMSELSLKNLMTVVLILPLERKRVFISIIFIEFLDTVAWRR
jgi:hypothetical protein